MITGAGTINSLGHTVPQTMAGMAKGACGIAALENIEDLDRLQVHIGAQVSGYDPAQSFPKGGLSVYDRFTQFALIAAREALLMSGLEFSDTLREKTGVVLGTAGGGVSTWDENYRTVYEDGKNRVHPFVVPKLMHNAAASHISIEGNLKGPAYTVSTACASSNHAMGQAFQMIRAGVAPVMITGGSEAMLCFGGIKAWESLRVMSTTGCRPFSKDRDGMVQGEGAAVFVFEDYDHARARGADPLAEVVGFSMTSDADNIVAPSADGAASAMAGALEDGGLSVEEVGYINAHGTGTVSNDRTEVCAIRRVFGAHSDNLMVSSTKSMHGHILGGTSAVELLACVMAIRDGLVAPTIGYQEKDPECDLDIVPNVAKRAEVEVAVSNAFAFGGLNAVLVLRKI